MNSRGIPAFVAGLTAILLSTSSAAHAASSGNNEINQVVVALAASEATYQNLYAADLGGGNAHASANCQFLVVFNAITANIAAAEGLGVIDSDRSIDIALPFGADSIRFEQNGKHANATCENEIGEFRIVDRHAAGWGEAAPQGMGLSSLWDMNGGGNTVNQAAASIAIFSGIVQNLVLLDMKGGNAHAAANCQLLVAANLLAVNAGLASAEGRITDDRSISLQPAPAPAAQNVPFLDIKLQDRTASADCHQVVDSFEIIIGADDDHRGES